MSTSTVYNLADQVHNISKQRNEVLHVMRIAVLLIQYCLSSGSRRASRAPPISMCFISKFTSSPKGMHITGVRCITNSTVSYENKL